MNSSILSGIRADFQHAMENPFGLQFVVVDKNIYIPLGSTINCLGYNDSLERIIGISRLAFALIALAASEKPKDRYIAAAHAFRGALEMAGSFEFYLLVLDIAATIYNIGRQVLTSFTKPATQELHSHPTT